MGWTVARKTTRRNWPSAHGTFVPALAPNSTSGSEYDILRDHDMDDRPRSSSPDPPGRAAPVSVRDSGRTEVGGWCAAREIRSARIGHRAVPMSARRGHWACPGPRRIRRGTDAPARIGTRRLPYRPKSARDDGVGRRPVVLAFPGGEDVGLHLVFRNHHAEMPCYQFAFGRAVELRCLDRDTHPEGVGVGLLERGFGRRAEGSKQRGA